MKKLYNTVYRRTTRYNVKCKNKYGYIERIDYTLYEIINEHSDIVYNTILLNPLFYSKILNIVVDMSIEAGELANVDLVFKISNNI